MVATAGLFDFLTNTASPLHLYYRYKVYTILQGSFGGGYPKEKFRIVKGGLLYRSPAHVPGFVWTFKDYTTSVEMPVAPGAPCNKNGGKPLTSVEIDEIDSMLSNVDTSRESISQAMIYLIEHGESAYPITKKLVDSLQDCTSVDSMLARLYIINDVLYNSCASREFAWVYRNSLEREIPRVIQHVRHSVKDALSSKLASQQLLDKTLKLVRIWQDWGVFSIDYIRACCNT
ncbi:bifunctional SWAP-Surp superfamily/CID domain/ENTH-VHS [Babesia duncani]|uniref:Bifunctional SWAP-Surp superfamily/CID domain/ENTH-VHS n=1 Tax=Babesia duncani TaxID=323732 RepID=A0AAD9PL69_9APIC|nr:bifunctional SWAP-Surp superfamily/CID domain/ENTH-VHS [Babesia duncani]